jgi:phosphatidate phosphatase APP1
VSDAAGQPAAEAAHDVVVSGGGPRREGADAEPADGRGARLARLSPARRWALRLEAVADRLRPPRRGPPLVEPYTGYATPDALILRGRCLTALRRTAPAPDQSRWTNLRQMVSLFLTSEVADVPVEAAGACTRTDEEGYFTLAVPRGDVAPGWPRVAVRVVDRPESEVAVEVLVPAPSAPALVISDIDDTVLQTGAYSLRRNLWTSLTGNALTRRVFPDTAALLRRFADAGAPVFYVSSSPWNLHHFLNTVFAANDVPKGPMFLRDLGINPEPGGHHHHKTAAIEAVLAAYPDLPAVLVGDTGQKDPAIYAAVAARRPGRVAAVYLREPRAEASPELAEAVAALRRQGVAVTVASSFDPAAPLALLATI